MDETSESSCNLEDDNASQIEELFTAAMQAVDAENRNLNQAFMLLPSRKVSRVNQPIAASNFL